MMEWTFTLNRILSNKERNYVGFDVLTAVVMENSVFWDITPRSLLKANRRLGGDMFLRNTG
jgi:hypothetical protein